LLASGSAVSEPERPDNESGQLSNPLTAPETLEVIKFITAMLQTTAAAFGLIVAIRNLLPKGSSVIAQNEANTSQLRVTNATSDESIRSFLGKKTN
jgi:hypothetical protein